ncbi:MAG: hypothetical protein FJ265_04895 [Planctomycetes bacterium]|nr:hypothetical protein [Planctomycetota bacterium]
MKHVRACGGWNVGRPWSLPFTAVVLLAGAAARAQTQDPEAEIERLRAQLGLPGADGRDARETAIVRLLAMPQPAAHRVLQQHLLRTEDVDLVVPAILAGLQQQLCGLPGSQFGGASADLRRELLVGYLGACARFWPADGSDLELVPGSAAAAARGALQRANARELADALAVLLHPADAATKARLLRCVADLQQLFLAPPIADYLEDADTVVRTAARRSLRLLTLHDEEFASRAQFAAWYERHRDVRYVDLAERAARDAERRAERAREEQERLRIDAAREFVRAHTSRRPGVDWAAIQGRTLVDDPTVLDACLELLQQSLAAGLPPDDSPVPRQGFSRALLQRWRTVAPEQRRRRAALLEVAALTARAEDAELATELTALLQAQLDAGTPDEQISALRGLRRFPTVDSRARIVRFAQQQLARGSEARPVLEAALATLSAGSAPRWCAPAENDPDKADWLALVRDLCGDPAWSDLRRVALQLAITLDARDQRVTDVFGMLLAFAKDRALDREFRSACLIQLQGWRDQSSLAEVWLAGMCQLLDDPAPEVRQAAAESLARLVEIVDSRRASWIATAIVAVRDHLGREPNPAVLRALVDTLQVCGREPQMPERAIGALNMVIAELGFPVPAEHQFRVDPLLAALTAVAGDPRADRGQWLGACRNLHQFEKRQSLRLVLQNHAAVDLGKDVGSGESSVAERAREAMTWLIRTALLKSAREPWNGSDDLLREARDVIVAFAALDPLDEAQRLDGPEHRILRLEVELAGGRFQEVVLRSGNWLGNGAAPAPGAAVRAPLRAEQKDRMRCLAAEAQLGLGKAELAARLLGERDPELPPDPRALDLEGRVARALAAADPGGAVRMLDKVRRATPPEDPSFRSRLLDWGQAALRHDPGGRKSTVAELERYRPLFEAQDCPPELRAQFLQLVDAK